MSKVPVLQSYIRMSKVALPGTFVYIVCCSSQTAEAAELEFAGAGAPSSGGIIERAFINV